MFRPMITIAAFAMLSLSAQAQEKKTDGARGGKIGSGNRGMSTSTYREMDEPKFEDGKGILWLIGEKAREQREHYVAVECEPQKGKSDSDLYESTLDQGAFICNDSYWHSAKINEPKQLKPGTYLIKYMDLSLSTLVTIRKHQVSKIRLGQFSLPEGASQIQVMPDFKYQSEREKLAHLRMESPGFEGFLIYFSDYARSHEYCHTSEAYQKLITAEQHDTLQKIGNALSTHSEKDLLGSLLTFDDKGGAKEFSIVFMFHYFGPGGESINWRNDPPRVFIEPRSQIIAYEIVGGGYYPVSDSMNLENQVNDGFVAAFPGHYRVEFTNRYGNRTVVYREAKALIETQE